MSLRVNYSSDTVSMHASSRREQVILLSLAIFTASFKMKLTVLYVDYFFFYLYSLPPSLPALVYVYFLQSFYMQVEKRNNTSFFQSSSSSPSSYSVRIISPRLSLSLSLFLFSRLPFPKLYQQIFTFTVLFSFRFLYLVLPYVPTATVRV